MNKLEELTKYSELFEIYKSLLTDKQKEIMERYINLDFSLNEIAEELNISRSGVLDAIEHAKKNLENYEEKLQLSKKFNFLEDKLRKENVDSKLIDEIMEGMYNGI